MSKTIDEKVVSMQFDNSQFEKNVQTSMSTLDKLKQALRLDGVSKGLENVGLAANKLDFSKSEFAATQAGFHIQDVFEKTTRFLENNIAKRIVDVGTNLFKTFTIDPVKTGFDEFELKMGSVQTIMASTGEDLESINKYLKELNDYSDKTIYSFADMTSNIGKFTNAGVKLEDAVAAIKGISNEAAVAGANANEASRAMYNFSQALSSGYVKLIDWKSIENANMATVEFKKTLLDTAVAMGTVVQKGDLFVTTTTDANGKISDAFNATMGFNDALSHQWMTTDVLTQALSIYATNVDELSEQEKKAYEEKLRGIGYTEEQIKKYEELGIKAANSAQDIKTFSMMMDTLKEAAQSGWAQTWELIIGDFEAGKKLWTKIGGFFDGIIGKISDVRNKILESALYRSFDDLKNKINEISDPIKKTTESIKTTVDAVKDYSKIVDKIIDGSFGNGASRWENLTQAGYDWAKAQNLVNEKLEDSKRYAESSSKSVDKLTDSSKQASKSSEEEANATKALTDEEKKRLESLTKLSEAELKSLGYSEPQIKAIQELRVQADKLGMSVGDFITNIDEINGRWILLHSLENIGQSLVTVFKAVGQAWKEVFHGDATEDEIIQSKADSLYNIITAFHKLTETLKVNSIQADQIRRTFKGLFAILDIIRTVVGGGVSFAFNVLKEVLSLFNTDLLEMTATVGDAIVAFRDWLKEHDIMAKAVQVTAQFIHFLVTKIVELVQKLYDMPKVQNGIKKVSDVIIGMIEGINKGFDTVKKFVDKLKELDGFSLKNINIALKDVIGLDLNDIKDKIKNKIIAALKIVNKELKEHTGIDLTSVGENIVEGLNNGILANVSSVISTIINLGKKLISSICEVLGIESPSRKFFEIGVFILEGLINGIISLFSSAIDIVANLGSKLFETIKKIDLGGSIANAIESISNSSIVKAIRNLFSNLIEAFKTIDWGALTTVAFGGASLFLGTKIANIFKNLSEPFDELGDIFKGLGSLLKNLGKGLKSELKAKAFKIRMEAILDLAKAIALLTASVWVLTKIPEDDLNRVLFTLGLIGIAVTGMSIALIKFGDSVNPVEMGKIAGIMLSLSAILISFSASMLLLSLTAKIISGMDYEGLTKAGVAILFFAGIVTGLIAATKLAGKRIDKVGPTILKVSAAMLLLSITAKIIASMEWSELGKATVGLVIFGGIITGLIAATKLAGNKINKVGPTILKVSAAMLLLSITAKIIAGMSWEDLGKAAVGIIFLGGIITGLVAVTKLAGDKEIKKIGSTILAVGASMLLLTITAKMIANMTWEDMGKASVGIVFLGAIITGLIWATNLATDKELKRIGSTLISISISVGILALTATLLSLVDTEGLKRGIIAVGILTLFVDGLILATRNAQDCKGNLMVMTIAIGVLAGAVAALSLIDPEGLKRATIALDSLLASFALVVAASKFAKGSVATIGALTVAVAALGVLLGLMNKYDIEPSIKTAGAISVLMIAMATSLAIMSVAGKNANKAIPALFAMSGAVAIIAIVLGTMDALNVEASMKTTIALSTLLLTMSASLVIMSVAGKNANKAIPALFAISGAVAIIAIILGVMDALNVEASMETALSLSVLLLAMSGVCAILALIGGMAPAALAGAAAFDGVVLIIGALMVGIGALMKYVPKLEEFLDKGIKVLGKIGYGIGSFLGNIASGFMSGVASGLPGIADDLSEFMDKLSPFLTGAGSVDSSALSGVKSIAEMIFILTATDVINSLTSWITGGSSMTDFADQLKPFGEAMVEFSEVVSGKIDAASIEAAANAGKLLAEMANTIPKIGGLSSKLSGENDLGIFAQKLVPFGKSIKEFSETVTGIDTASVESAANAGKLLAEMAKALPNSGGLISLFTGENDMLVFAKQLVPFGEAIVSFSGTVTGIDANAVESAANAGKLLAEMAKTIPNTGGLVSLFAGENDMALFGFKLKIFGKYIVDFAQTVAGKINIDAVTAASNAGKTMVELANTIPRTGGLVSFFAGSNDMGTFGKNIKTFGKCIAEFSETVTGRINAPAIEASANAGKMMVELQNTIPKTGGVVSFFAGKNDIGTFGKNIKTFGKCIAGFSETVTGKINVPAIEAASNAGKMMVELQNTIPKTGGVISFFEGRNNMATFGKNIKTFGNCIVTFSETVTGKINAPAIEASINAGNAVSKLADNLSESSSGNSLNDFSKHLTTFGYGIESFATSISGVSFATVNSAIHSCKSIVDLARSIAGTDFSVFKEFSNATKNLGTNVMGDFVKSFDTNSTEAASKVSTSVNTVINAALSTISLSKSRISASTKTAMGGFTEGVNSISEPSKTAINNILNAIVTSIQNKKMNVTNAFRNLVSEASNAIESVRSNITSSGTTLCNSLISGIRAKYSSMVSAGKYLGEGLVSGINAKEEDAYNAGYDLGRAAVRGEKDGQQSNSPSKATIKAGGWLGEGLVIGMKKMGSAVYKSGESMGANAVDSISEAISQISDISTDDLDVTPTIRPVVDMSNLNSSDVELGANIDACLTRPVDSLSSIIANAQNEMNASNNEVIKIMNGLREDLNSLYSMVSEKETTLYVDSKQLANSLAKPMNRELNILSKRGAY